MDTLLNTLSTTDSGDDMQRRLRYQAAYGALKCLDLLEDETVIEILCEHHEDFLLKKNDGKFVGIQVKTRHPQYGPFKSNDAAVVQALTRFVELDIQFPSSFAYFVIVANCDFWNAADNEKNLAYVLEKLITKTNPSLKGTMKEVIASLRKSCKCKKEVVIEVLRRTRLEGNVPKFEDITTTVAMRIGRIDEFRNQYMPELWECAVALIDRILDSSALSCDLPARTHYIFASDPKDAFVVQVISHKRMTSALVLSILRSKLAQAVMLKTSKALNVKDWPLGHHRLEKKMAAGDISFQSIDVSKDHQSSAEVMLQEWLHRYGSSAATKRYQQLDLLVRTQCAEAYDETYSESAPFGAQMLKEVRQRLSALASNASLTFGAKYEQLLGIASLATQECRIWWSKKFDIPESV
jgi:hypothetical protein